MPSVSFDIYGLGITVTADDEGVIEDVSRDFSYFLGPAGAGGALVEVRSEPLCREGLPPLPAAFHTPRNTVYRDGDTSYIDYGGRAIAICHGRRRACTIRCDDRDLAHEIAYLTLLSRAGEHLDAGGLFRVHALGLAVAGRGVLILLPMAGGKTTLALKLLEAGGVKLLSEDSPLIRRDGMVLPFPLRIGVRAGLEPPGVPPAMRRTVERMEHGPKTLIDVAHFGGRIADAACPIGAVLVGCRRLAGPADIRRQPRRKAVGAFVKNAVVGLGLYQGMEFVLERSSWEVFSRAGLAMRRLWCSLAVIRRAEVYRFDVGPDADETAAALGGFLAGLADRWPACGR